MKNASVLLLFVLLAAAPRLTTQGDLRVYFLGRADSRGDGLLDSRDRLALYRSLGAAEAERISDEAVDVAEYLPAASGVVASLGLLTDSFVLDLLPPDAAPVRVTLSDWQAAHLLALGDALWLVGYGADRLPILRGLDPRSGALVAERQLRRANTQVTVSASGDFALAYHAQAGAISVFRLPSLETVAFELSGYALAAPIWSPTAPRFFLAAARMDDPSTR